MNRWLQTKTYQCEKCSAFHLHDLMYRHSLFTCPNRPAPKTNTKLMRDAARMEPTGTADLSRSGLAAVLVELEGEP